MSAPVEPVTVGLTCEWDRARFELLDRRVDVLRKFDEQQILGAFSLSVAPDLILETLDGRVFFVGVENLRVYEVARDDRRAGSSIDLAIEIGEMLGVVAVKGSVSLQHMFAWPEETDASRAFASAARRVLGDASVEPTDFALLYDGRGQNGWTYQVEFGVIAAEDAPDRLLRRVGRAPSWKLPTSLNLGSSASFSNSGMGEVTTFVDSTWTAPEPILLSDMSDLVTEVIDQANELAAALDSWIR